MVRFIGVVFAAALMAGLGNRARAIDAEVEQWGIFEIRLTGPSTGNPFVQGQLSARITQGKQTVEVAGFYDGDGVYRIRFMPEKTGKWDYVTQSSRAELN